MAVPVIPAISRRRVSRLLVILTLSAAAGTSLGCTGQDGSLSSEGLPRYAYRTETALASYRYAVAEPDLLSKLPCYCGCGQLPEFLNLRDCFVDANGAFNAHGANCQTCIDEALDAKRLHAEGHSVAEIRQMIDRTYQGRGKPTNTPPVD
jgi:hypothetical protein